MLFQWAWAGAGVGVPWTSYHRPPQGKISGMFAQEKAVRSAVQKMLDTKIPLKNLMKPETPLLLQKKKDPLHVCIPVYMCTQTYSQTHRFAWTVEHILELQLATHGASRCPRCVMGLGTFHHRKPESPHLSPSSQPPLEVTQCVLKIQQQKWFPSWAVLSCFFPSYSIII